MGVTSRNEAQRRADEIRIFRAEFARAGQDGAVRLDDAQRAALDAYHDELLARLAREWDVDCDTRAGQLSLGMRVASLLGALALAAAVVFLLLRYFGLLATPLQVTLLVALPLAALGFTAWLRGVDDTGYFTRLAAMVAFACFVLDLALLADVFNIRPSDRALLPWAAFAFLVAYACNLRLLLGAGILCLVAWIASRTAAWADLGWPDFGSRPENFLPAGVLLFVLPLFAAHPRHPDFPPVYRVAGLLCLLLPMLVLGLWGYGSYLPWRTASVGAMYQVLGFAGSASAIWLGVRRGWQDTVNTGIALFVVFLYVKFFDWWWNSLPKWLFFLVLALTAVLVLLVLRRLRLAGIAGSAPR